MPLAQISIMEGRTEEQKARMIREVTEALCHSLGVPRESVRVLVQDVPKSHWGIGGETAAALGR